MEVTPDKRQRARELADEYLGRGAAVARATVAPLGVIGRVAIVAGAVIWIAGPAPFWDSAPSTVASVILLALFLAPGVRLLRHRRRTQMVLDDLPTLVEGLTPAGMGRSLKDLTDALGAFGGPALMLSGVALLAAIVEIVLSPIAVIIRLFI